MNDNKRGEESSRIAFEESARLREELARLRGTHHACHENEARYRLLFEQMVHGYVLFSAIFDTPEETPRDYRFLDANPAFARYAGMPRESIVGKTVSELFPSADPVWLDAYHQVVITGVAKQLARFSPLFGRYFEATVFRTSPDQIAVLFTDVSVRHRLEEERDRMTRELQQKIAELRRTTTLMRRAEQLARVGYWYGDLQTGEVLWSEGMSNLLGFPPNPQMRITGELYEFVHPDDRVELARAVKEAVAGRGTYSAEFRAYDIEGKEHYVRVLGEIERKAGRPVANFGIGQDISQIKRAETALRESEERFRRQAAELDLVYSTAPVGLCVIDTELRFVHVNQRLAEINGVTIENHLGRTLREVVPDIARRVEPQLRKVLERGEPVINFETTAETPAHPGAQRTWNSQYWPLRQEDGTIIGINVVVEEITERRRLEESRRREHEFRTLAENSTDIVVRFDRALRRVYANPAIEKLFGRPRDEIMGRSNEELGLKGPYIDEWNDHLLRALRSGEPQSVDLSVTTPRGKLIFECHVIPEQDANGNVETLLTITRDITERKHAEEELFRREQEFEALVERSPDIIVRVDRHGHVLYINPAVEKLTGRQREWFIGKTPAQLELPQREQAIREAIIHEVLTTGREFSAEHDFTAADGPHYFHVRLVPEFDASGTVCSILIVDRDITDLKRAQFALEELTLHDPLTGIANRRYLARFIEREWRREVRHRHSVAVIMADIDFFKAYNDRYGHQQGDDCLRQVAEALEENLRRPTDLLVRYGGEEFAVILLESDMSAALRMAEAMHEAVEERSLSHEESEVAPVVTISLGVSAAPANLVSFDDLLSAADQALYRAKRNGRNRVETGQPPRAQA